MSLNQRIKLLILSSLLSCLVLLAEDRRLLPNLISSAHAASGSGSDGVEEDAEEAAEEAAEEVAEQAAEAAEEAAEAAERAAEEAAEEAAEAAEEQAELAEEAAIEAAEEQAELAAESAEEAAEQAAEAAEEAAEAIAEQAEEAAEAALEQAEEAAELAADQAEEAAERAEELAESEAEAVEESIKLEEKAAKRAEKETQKAAERNADKADRRAEEVSSSADTGDVATANARSNSGKGSRRTEDVNRTTSAISGERSATEAGGANTPQTESTNGRGSQGLRNVQRAESQQEKLDDSERFVIDIELDQDNNEVVRNELLLLVDIDEFALLEDKYPQIERLQNLTSLGRVLAKYYSIEKFDPDEVTRELIATAPTIEVDRNHVLYEPSTTSAKPSIKNLKGQQPGDLFRLDVVDDSPVRIGVIDTAVDTSHSWLRDRALTTRSFVPNNARQPLDHGTAVVSTLLGSASDYDGLLPQAQVIAASIFVQQGPSRRITTAEYIAAALEWLMQQDLRVINMSFTGPYSRVLDRLIQDATDQGVLLVAAAGNHGPGAPPLYPAAYRGAIAVTAVSADKRVYRLANRGAHIMFSAPGVNILHAGPDESTSMSSGTSMASPFVAALLGARMVNEENSEVALKMAVARAEDLGKKGRDETYGYGLIKP